MRLPVDSASEKAEVDISDTLLLRECWRGSALAESVRWCGVDSAAKRDSLRMCCPGLAPLTLSKADFETSCCRRETLRPCYTSTERTDGMPVCWTWPLETESAFIAHVC